MGRLARGWNMSQADWATINAMGKASLVYMLPENGKFSIYRGGKVVKTVETPEAGIKAIRGGIKS